MDSLTILAPAFNEEKNIIPFLSHFYEKLENNWEILIVNDGSNDGTRKVLTEINNEYPNLTVITHEFNKGIGKAFETGFKNINTDYVITIDADLSHTFSVVDELYKNRHKADVVIASMNDERSDFSNASKIRVLIAKIGNYIISKLIGVRVHEVAGGPRIYRTDKIKNLQIEHSGFESQVEIIKKLSKAGCTFNQCALYLDKRLYGKSKMNYLKSIIGVIKVIFTR